MPAGTGPLDYQRDVPGVRIVNIWYKGNIVLSGNYTVPSSASPSDVLQLNSYWVIALMVTVVLVTILYVKFYLLRS
jgi:hypothetical protein